MEITASGGNTLRRAAFVMLGAWGCVLLAVGRASLKVDPLLAGSIGTLLGLAAISFVWTSDPGMCLRRLLTLLCCVIAAAGVARALSLREISWLILSVFGGLAMI